LRTWRDGWRHLRFLLIYSPRWLFLYPGFLLMLLGGSLTAWLLPGPRYIGRVGFDVDTMVFAAAFIFVGYQAVIFALFTKVFAITEGMLPADKQMERLLDIVTLETGLLVGGLLVACGTAISLIAVNHWRTLGFGPLDPTTTFRAVMPAAIFLTTGVQTIFSSFFLSVLGMARR